MLCSASSSHSGNTKALPVFPLTFSGPNYQHFLYVFALSLCYNRFVNLAFLLHIYQPPIQEGKVLKEITETSYIPLFRLIKNLLSAKFTFNIPLSLAYQWHLHGYDDLISDVKSLYEDEKIELVSCGAYHPLLTRLPEHLVEDEVVLNEYALGYYFGKDKGFEGEDALMLKNVNGFFPPEMALNDNVLNVLESLGYSWVIADEVAVPIEIRKEAESSVYDFAGKNIKLVVRDTHLSNTLAFTRDTETSRFIEEVLRLRQEGKDAVVALDGEFFGHHYEEGLYLLENLVNELEKLGIRLTTVSELVDASDTARLDKIVESTWAASQEAIDAGDNYPMWDIQGNEIQALMWELFNAVVSTAGSSKFKGKFSGEEIASFVTFPVWDPAEVSKIEDEETRNKIKQTNFLLQAVSSDPFWWASNVEIGGRPMFRQDMILNSLEIYKKFGELSGDEALQKSIKEHSEKIQALL